MVNFISALLRLQKATYHNDIATIVELLEAFDIGEDSENAERLRRCIAPWILIHGKSSLKLLEQNGVRVGLLRSTIFDELPKFRPSVRMLEVVRWLSIRRTAQEKSQESLFAEMAPSVLNGSICHHYYFEWLEFLVNQGHTLINEGPGLDGMTVTALTGKVKLLQKYLELDLINDCQFIESMEVVGAARLLSLDLYHCKGSYTVKADMRYASKVWRRALNYRNSQNLHPKRRLWSSASYSFRATKIFDSIEDLECLSVFDQTVQALLILERSMGTPWPSSIPTAIMNEMVRRLVNIMRLFVKSAAQRVQLLEYLIILGADREQGFIDMCVSLVSGETRLLDDCSQDIRTQDICRFTRALCMCTSTTSFDLHRRLSPWRDSLSVLCMKINIEGLISLCMSHEDLNVLLHLGVATLALHGTTSRDAYPYEHLILVLLVKCSLLHRRPRCDSKAEVQDEVSRLIASGIRANACCFSQHSIASPGKQRDPIIGCLTRLVFVQTLKELPHWTKTVTRWIELHVVK